MGNEEQREECLGPGTKRARTLWAAMGGEKETSPVTLTASCCGFVEVTWAAEWEALSIALPTALPSGPDGPVPQEQARSEWPDLRFSTRTMVWWSPTSCSMEVVGVGWRRTMKQQAAEQDMSSQ